MKLRPMQSYEENSLCLTTNLCYRAYSAYPFCRLALEGECSHSDEGQKKVARCFSNGGFLSSVEASFFFFFAKKN